MLAAPVCGIGAKGLQSLMEAWVARLEPSAGVSDLRVWIERDAARRATFLGES